MAAKCYEVSQAAYRDANLLGAPEKNVTSDRGKAGWCLCQSQQQSTGTWALHSWFAGYETGRSFFDDMDQNDPKLIPLPRSVAMELVLLAVSVPLALSDLGAEFLTTVFATATDASSRKGAICSTEVSARTVRAL